MTFSCCKDITKSFSHQTDCFDTIIDFVDKEHVNKGDFYKLLCK